MSGEASIEFVISRNGTIKSTVKKVKGPGCGELARRLSQDLGQVVKSERTREYYEVASVNRACHIGRNS